MILTRCQDVTLRSPWWPWRICKEARNVYCLAMALYCPLPGQFLAIARQETTRREEEGEATRRRSNKKKKQQEEEGARRRRRRREKLREKDYSRFYSSLFTKSSETPINTGVLRGEELAHLFTTLHHSSPHP